MSTATAPAPPTTELPTREVRVAIVGAGFGGIGAAIKLWPEDELHAAEHHYPAQLGPGQATSVNLADDVGGPRRQARVRSRCGRAAPVLDRRPGRAGPDHRARPRDGRVALGGRC